MSDERARKAAEEIQRLILTTAMPFNSRSFRDQLEAWFSRHFAEPAPTQEKCADCGHAIDDPRFHLDSPGVSWGAALHWFRPSNSAMRETCSTTDSPPAAELAKWRETHPTKAAEPGAVARESQPKNPTDDVYALDKFWEWAEQNGVNGAVRIEHKQRVDEVAVAYAAHCLRQHREREERWSSYVRRSARRFLMLANKADYKSEIKRLYLALEQAREREERLRRMIRLLCERFGYMGEMMFSPEDWAAIRKEVEG